MLHHQTPFDLKDGSRRKKSGLGAYIAKGARLCWPGESNTQEVSTEARKKHLLEKMFSCTRSTKPLTCAARSAASRTSAHGILAPRIAPTSTCASAGPRPTQRENTATCISTTEDPISANRASRIGLDRGLPLRSATKWCSSTNSCRRRGGEQRVFDHFLSDLPQQSRNPFPAWPWAPRLVMQAAAPYPDAKKGLREPTGAYFETPPCVRARCVGSVSRVCQAPDRSILGTSCSCRAKSAPSSSDLRRQ